MSKLHLSYAGYADHLTGQLGDPTMVFPVPLMDGVLGFFGRDDFEFTGFHIEHSRSFNDWEGLRELLGDQIVDGTYELHQQVGSLELPSLSGLSEDELRPAMQQSVVRREFEVNWGDDPDVAARLRGIVDRWETGG